MKLRNLALINQSTATSYGVITFDNQGIADTTDKDVIEKLGNLKGFEVLEGKDAPKDQIKPDTAPKKETKGNTPKEEEKRQQDDSKASGDVVEPKDFDDITVAEIEEALEEANQDVPEGNKKAKYEAYLTLFD